MQNILVTGGAGFIGSHTVVELFKAGYRPVIVDNFSNSDESIVDGVKKIIGTKIKVYKNDFQDKAALKKIFKKEAIEGVIHFAAAKAVGESVEQPLKYYNNNVSGLITLLEVMEESKVANFVFSSSCTVYGEADLQPITEKAQFKPAESPYGATKQMGEIIVSDATKASKQLKSLSLRYFNPVGAHPSGLIGELPIGVPANLVPYITQTAAGIRHELTVFGNDYPTADGTCVRDFIHVVDLAKAHISALKHVMQQKKKYSNAINVGTGKGNSVLEVIKTFEKVNKQKVPYKIGLRRKGDIISAYASVSKAKKILGWEATYDLATALKDAWHWQQSLTKSV